VLLVYHSPKGHSLPLALKRATSALDLCVEVASTHKAVLRKAAHARVGVVVDGSQDPARALALCRALKADPITAVTPLIVWTNGRGGGVVVEALEAGADEVIPATMAGDEQHARLARALARADRDLSVHPSTRLPGTVEIERDLARRLASAEGFSAGYVDLDHFKDFNDRYGYHSGDGIIHMTAAILREAVRSLSRDPFVGHIGGDDFIFHCRADEHAAICEAVITSFDEQIIRFYSEEDRIRGGFPGQDRRNIDYFVPIMSISIGVATTAKRPFEHTGEVHRVLRELKEHAKSEPGSLYLVDRRSVPVAPPPTAAAEDPVKESAHVG
jgi:diguanylate cyclase (GGDEF)-like protein